MSGALCESATARRNGATACAGVAAFQQRLPLEFVEIGIVRLGLDQSVDLDEGVTQIAMKISRDGVRIARRQAVIGQRIAAVDRILALQKSGQLCPDHVVAQLQRGRILDVKIGARLAPDFQRRDAIGRHGCDCKYGIGVARN